MYRIVVLLATSSIIAAASSVLADDGLWSASDDFAQVNLACFRVYTCGPASDIIYDENSRLVSTPPQTVWGVCSVGGGAIDSCNVCLTNPPTRRCEWRLEPR